MCILIRQLFLPITLSVLFLFVPSAQHATGTREHVDLSSYSDKYLNFCSIENGYVSLASSGSPGNSFEPNTAGPQSLVLARGDIYEIIFGTFLSIIGLALIVLSLLRWKANDLSLISFGILCFLYGARTRAFHILFDIPLLHYIYTLCFITYVIPIPAWLFIEQFLGKGWKSSIRRLLQVQIVFSIIAISVSAYLGNPYAAMAANSIIVIIGLLIVIPNFFQPHLQPNRELKMLRAGFLILALQLDDRIILYTDGIVETSNTTHTLFGLERLKEFTRSHAQLPAGQFADALIRHLLNWSGKPSEEALDYDLTRIIVDYQHV